MAYRTQAMIVFEKPSEKWTVHPRMVKLGIDNLFSKKMIGLAKRMGLLAHPASINKNYKHTLDLLLEKGVKVTQLFGPEHGLFGTAQDMVGCDSQTDPRTGLPVASLYGNHFDSLSPKAEHLKNIDILVCDLQDVGSRYYTFIYTIALCMKACAQKNIPVVVLDRPNPINGVTLEGPLLQPGFESFVGLFSGIPVRHAFTVGELALYFNTEHKIHCDLTVVSMKGWKRSMYYDDTDLPWINPSPNMPSLETALVYPGMCLVEATEVSEGRGTTKPFELAGAPFIEPDKLVASLEKEKLPGVVFRPTWFRPMFQKWAGIDCGGIQLHITNQKTFKSFATGLAFIKHVAKLYPQDFQWRSKTYEFVDTIPAIDLLTGSAQIRESLPSLNIEKLERKSLKSLKLIYNLYKKYHIY
ncbi:MAG TPA: DUF1343 domain-containing protein [Deltaproteobacteria bacterium]|nr:DUF1343 domain-containing protein [Deltaproteobacteria bacterium]